MITSERHIGLQQGTSDTCSSIPAVNDEARDPPDVAILVREHPREGSVTAYTEERFARPHSAPPDRPVVGVSDEAGWHDSIPYLHLECASIVRWRS